MCKDLEDYILKIVSFLYMLDNVFSQIGDFFHYLLLKLPRCLSRMYVKRKLDTADCIVTFNK